jgi:hypothetical protein
VQYNNIGVIVQRNMQLSVSGLQDCVCENEHWKDIVIGGLLLELFSIVCYAYVI